jgi:hypothetical protein
MVEQNETIPVEQTTVDYLLVADYAEVINGRAYIMGAGWDKFAPPAYPAPMRIGIAVGIRVPYLESNTPHRLSVRLRNGDGQEVFKIEGDLETGRPPGSRGDSILVPLAVNAQVDVPAPQLFELLAEVDGQSTRRISIRAMKAGSPTQP